MSRIAVGKCEAKIEVADLLAALNPVLQPHEGETLRMALFRRCVDSGMSVDGANLLSVLINAIEKVEPGLQTPVGMLPKAPFVLSQQVWCGSPYVIPISSPDPNDFYARFGMDREQADYRATTGTQQAPAEPPVSFSQTCKGAECTVPGCSLRARLEAERLAAYIAPVDPQPSLAERRRIEAEAKELSGWKGADSMPYDSDWD